MDDQYRGMTYESVGVDYSSMDPFKRACQAAARETAQNLKNLGDFVEVEVSRGESAYVIKAGDVYLAHVEEGLGTKNLVADAMEQLTGRVYYHEIAQDTVAMIVNDMATLGAQPLSVAMHLAVGDSEWFTNPDRCQALIDGWRDACDLARCAWGGGETPTLRDVIVPGRVVLSGSAMGVVQGFNRLLTASSVVAGDAIVVIASSGIHANGLTMARRIADQLPDGYRTLLSDGRSYGDALLDPTHIYVGLVGDCFKQGVDVHYAVNITGHGWCKLMRAPQPLRYVVHELPQPQPVFPFIQEHGNVALGEMYQTFNMGGGFALYVPEIDVDDVVRIAKNHQLNAWQAGIVEAADTRSVVLEPLGLEYDAASLAVR